ncbi:MAG: flagellar biosynthetic protein FliO [Oscillospiraceae bacterium]|nr:flagellar biosynthetic protein FliO [Oscillospiraceae bacterium]
MILSLTGIIGLILLMFWMLRKVNKISATASGSNLKIIDRANAGREASLLVVSVGGRLMLVGVSAGRIEKLCDLDISEEEYFGSASASGSKDKPNPIFAEVLSNFLLFKKKGALKGRETEEEQTDEKSIQATARPQAEGEENTVESDNQTGSKRE